MFVDCYNLKRHGVYSALNWSFLVWGIYNLVKFPSHDRFEEALQVFFERMKLAEIDSPEELKQLFDEAEYYIVQEVRL